MNMANVYPSRQPSMATNRGDDLTSAPISGLPRQFVNSMKTLFNILDDAGVGLVPLAEIERRWRDDAVPNLPGVLDSLRAVAPEDGMLSFETFVWGLRSALARARQCRDKNKFVNANNFKNAFKHGTDADAAILPNYYYQNRTASNGKTKPPNSKSSGLRQASSRNDGSDTEGLRNGSYVTQQTWVEKNDVTFGRYPISGQHGDNGHQGRHESRGFKPGHRRSSSGPISTAKVLPTPWGKDFSNGDEVKITKMGYATKFSAQSNKNDVNDKENEFSKSSELCGFDEVKSDSSLDKNSFNLKTELASSPENAMYQSKDDSQSDTSHVTTDNQSPSLDSERKKIDSAKPKELERSDLDRVTANTLFINTDNHSTASKMKPIGLSGKYIGITGTMQRTKSSAMITSQYGSLRRPAMSAPTNNLTSASETCFSSSAAVNAERRRHKSGSRYQKQEDPRRRQYASAGESGDESHPRAIGASIRGSSSERKRGASIATRDGNDRAGQDGAGRRCNSASPPERPALKSARSSTSPDLLQESRRAIDEGGVDTTSRSKSASPEEKPRQLQMPPPSGRNMGGRSNAISKSQEMKTSASNTTGNYATVGRRRTSSNKRRDPRRHTVANGIDYNTLKYIKQLDQEKDLLLQGMDALDRGREWFQCRLYGVQDRQRVVANIGVKTSCPEGEVEQAENSILSQDQLDSLLTRISDMSRLVKAMTNPGDMVENDNGEKSPVENPTVVNALREQNHLLTTEVSKQAERIAQLEREKSVLVQQLFQAKAEAQCVDGHVNTSIFI